MKIVTVVGARPQFIKAAVVSRAIAEHNDSLSDNESRIHEVILHTGQHYDANMSDVFFNEMAIPRPNYFLDINDSSHGAMTGKMLVEIETILLAEKPEWVLVYGDTNSTLAGALAASKINIPIAHVEAGLRSYNRRMPEEINRILTDHVSTVLFCPTKTAVNNLALEGITKEATTRQRGISQVGDVMYDATLVFKSFAKKPEFEVPNKFVLATLHRAENTDDETRLASILAALGKISTKNPVVLPIHPRTKKIIAEAGIIPDQSIIIVNPVSYLEMLYLLKHCQLVMTDSGGLQKEAYFFSKLCIALRDETEWVELVELGVNALVGADTELILNQWKTFANARLEFETNLYGKGNAGQEIVQQLLSVAFETTNHLVKE